jgi:acetoacetate decarboxylase
MKAEHVRAHASAMPLSSPAFPMGPYRLIGREFLIYHLADRSQSPARGCAGAARIGEPLVHY